MTAGDFTKPADEWAVMLAVRALASPLVSDAGSPPPASDDDFGRAMAESFRRRRPQGSLRWNYDVAFALLEEEFGAREPDPLSPDGASPLPAGSGPGAPPAASRRIGMDRLRRWVEARAEAVAAQTTERVLREGLGRRGVGQTVEALRFLGRRVEVLEGTADRRRRAVRAPSALVEPPSVGPWVDPLSRVFAAVPEGADVLHAECGDGELVAALRERGMRAQGAEPRGPVAFAASRRGVPVELEDAASRLERADRESMGGIVLSGVVDRVPVEDLVELVGTAVQRLAPGGILVVISADPASPLDGWPAVARDLLPGRPLHPETWRLLLTSAGLAEVESLGSAREADSHATTGRRLG